MNESPDKPGEKAAHSDVTGLQDGEVLADDRHGALVPVSKRVLRIASPDPIGDQAPDIAPLLDCGLRDAGYWPSIAHDCRRVSDGEDAGNTLDIHEWAD